MIVCISKGNAVAAFFAQSAMGISLSLWGAPSKSDVCVFISPYC